MSLVTRGNVRITELFRICSKQNIPFVAYYLPGSDQLNIIVQYKSLPRKLTDLSELSSLNGFIVAPFDLENHLPVYFFEPDFHITSEVSNDQLDTLLKTTSFQHISHKKEEVFSTSQKEYVLKVSQCQKLIANGSFEKLVISRVLKESASEGFNPALFLELIYQAYPDTLRYIFNIPGVGLWMGATPESLVTTQGSSVQITSLAGTQKLSNSFVDDISWGSKELIEQRFVTNYIEAALGKFGETIYEKQGPVNFRAANVVHLKTVFNIQSHRIVSGLGAFIKELHPTPSVCGLPKGSALTYIKTLESHSREYYSGFLGPLNMLNETHLFVNLRCLQYVNNNFILYAGAGITAGSNPELEWEETNQKLVAMLSIIQQTKQVDGK
jgi:isochorismate synthase